MRFLILNTDYPDFLRWLYALHPGLERQPYEEQTRIRNESLFGVADFYSSNLRKLGHEAWDVHANNESMQRGWAREHGVRLSFGRSLRFRMRRGVVPWVSLARNRKWMYEILAAQIRHFKPDALYNLAIGLDGRFFRKMRPHVGLLVGQHASPLPPGNDLGAYDLMTSSLPNLVDDFRSQGLDSELHRLGFGRRVLERLGQPGEAAAVSFVGTVSEAHAGRLALLEHLCRHTDLQVWGRRLDALPRSSPVVDRSHGPVWGVDMYQLLRDSRVTLNHHIDVAGSYANNMRLYEATGVGTLLVTDWKEDLAEMFEPGKEVVAYRSQEECVELIRYYLDHHAERERIARAGQERTLREHTYYERMRELVDIVGRYL